MRRPGACWAPQFCLHGDEAIHGIIDLINADQPIDTLEWAVPIHPTVSELWPTLARALAPAQ